MEVRLISRCATPEGLETRKGYMTLHLLDPHTSSCHTVGACSATNCSHPMVTVASRFSNPEGFQTHRGFMALDLLDPHTSSCHTVGACNKLLPPHGDGGLEVQ
jgi:hypothetical protein